MIQINNLFISTFPMIQASPLVAISTRADGVHVINTSKSAIDRLSRNRFVERPSLAPPPVCSLLVRITMITNRLPKTPMAKILVKNTKLIVAVYSGKIIADGELSLLMLIVMKFCSTLLSTLDWKSVFIVQKFQTTKFVILRYRMKMMMATSQRVIQNCV